MGTDATPVIQTERAPVIASRLAEVTIKGFVMPQWSLDTCACERLPSPHFSHFSGALATLQVTSSRGFCGSPVDGPIDRERTPRAYFRRARFVCIFDDIGAEPERISSRSLEGWKPHISNNCFRPETGPGAQG